MTGLRLKRIKVVSRLGFAGPAGISTIQINPHGDETNG
jgi:hypothetical protein